jgi:pimeloyl-ACP methyl ester carboxylesterase
MQAGLDQGSRAPVAVLLPGSGSTADFVHRAFDRPLAAAGYRLVAPEPQPGPGVVAAAAAALAGALRQHRVALVGGVSLGAHVATSWAAAAAGTGTRPGTGSPVGSSDRDSSDRDSSHRDSGHRDSGHRDSGHRDSGHRDAGDRAAGDRAAGDRDAGDRAAGDRDGSDGATVAGLLLTLPAWTGPPGAVAAAAAAAATAVQRYGRAGALQVAAAAGGERWVVDELAVAWPRYGADLAATLRATAAAPGPSRAELRRIDLPVGLVGFRDDPMHPAEVTEEWAGLLPRCAVEWLDLADLAADRSRLGAAALTAWRRAGGS